LHEFTISDIILKSNGCSILLESTHIEEQFTFDDSEISETAELLIFDDSDTFSEFDVTDISSAFVLRTSADDDMLTESVDLEISFIASATNITVLFEFSE
jgi:hypothetical protein